MHHIQRKILDALLYAESLGYAQMRPAGIESNHYAYHLEQLLKAGLVAKHDKKYSLAPAGLAYVDRLSQAKMVDRLQPHIVTVIDVTNDHGETLLYKRAFQPYINSLSFPLGKIHYEESIAQAAERELQEKAGLTDIPLDHRGVVYLTITQNDFIVSKELCHVFSATIKGRPELTQPTRRGSCEWAKVTSYSQNDFMPGFLAIKKLLQTNNTFFFAEKHEKI